jgi:hypothetical protein
MYLHHDVRAERQRILQVGGGEGVVHHQAAAGARRNLAAGRHVHQPQHRIGGALDPHELRLGAHRRGHRVEVRRIDPGEANPEARKHMGEEAVGSPVEVVAHDDVVAGGEQLREPADRRHARGVGHAEAAAFEGGQAIFEGVAGGIAAARVFPTLVLADGRLGVGGGLMDRNDGGAGGRVRRLAGVDRPGFETLFGGILLHRELVTNTTR